MSQTTLLTREPVVNKNRAITANRLIAHGPNIAAVVEALSAQAEVWPTHHPVFISLGRLVPTPELMDWAIPANVAIEIPVQTLALLGPAGIRERGDRPGPLEGRVPIQIAQGA